jgi:hypothetical protein
VAMTSPLEQNGYLLIYVRNGRTAPYRYNFNDIKSWSMGYQCLFVNLEDRRVAYPMNNVLGYEVVYNSPEYVEAHSEDIPEDSMYCTRCGAKQDG